jgi:uncharacterized protein
MSQQNVEVVRRMYEAFRRGDAEAALDSLDSDVVMDATHRVDGRIGRGHDQVSSILREWLGTWEEWSEEIEEVRDLGDVVLVVSSQHGRGRGSGVEMEHRFAMLYEVRNDKVVRWTIYNDREQALEAAGSSQ